MSSSTSKLIASPAVSATGSDVTSLLSLLASDLKRTRVPLLVLLLAADLLFIALHMTHTVLGTPAHAGFSIKTPHGYGEMLQSVKALWIGLALLWLGLGLRQRTEHHVFAIWGLLFLYLATDDAIEVHEQVGLWLSHAWHLPPVAQLRPEDVGELLFHAGVGLTALPLLVLFHFRADADGRRGSRQLLMLLGLFVLFAVGIDTLAMLVQGLGLGIIEDAGEMVVMSLILVFALHLPQQSTGLPPRMFRR